jgi:alkylation response protein AidB-like acyl-CoA dehydrogenase
MPTAPAGSTAPPSSTSFNENDLLVRARALGPVIREHAGAAERERRLARPVIDAMREAGLFRMFTPRSLGGLEMSPVDVARIAEEVGSFDSAAGWALQAGNTGAWWSARLPDQAVAEVFADGPDVIMAASFSPPHRAEAVPDGYRFTGRGPFASTIHDASWIMLTGIVHDGETPRMTPFGPAIVGLILRTSQIEIIDTWESLGMRGTDSNDVVADGVFIPASHSFMVSPEFQPGPHFKGPLYRLPAPASVDVVIAPVALAVARGAIDEVRTTAERKTPLGSVKTLRHRASVQAAIADAEARLRSARLLFYHTLEEAWQRAVRGDHPSLEDRADLMLASTHAVHTASQVADLMHRSAGTSGIYARNRLERHFRDAQTLRHHGFLCESRLETVGQVYLGVEPEFGFVAF